jgi:BRCA1-associated protein
VCDSTDDLWICLICGNVGCGRYKGGHAKDHWKETAHSFALELETQHIWDYAGDMWVHRLLRNKGDGKVVELPGTQRMRSSEAAENDDLVPRAKLDNIGLEYTHLLSSQLESQRQYFEEIISKISDKASKAASAADSASSQLEKLSEMVAALKAENEQLKTEGVPRLERDLSRERNRATKAQELARGLSKSLQEEQKVSEGLMKRVEHLNQQFQSEVPKLKAQVEELMETNRDLTMFISGQERLKELELEGKVTQEDLASGSTVVAEKKVRKKGKK